METILSVLALIGGAVLCFLIRKLALYAGVPPNGIVSVDIVVYMTWGSLVVDVMKTPLLRKKRIPYA